MSGDELRISIFGLSLVFLTPALVRFCSFPLVCAREYTFSLTHTLQGGFLFGYDIGASSFVLQLLRNGSCSHCWWKHFHHSTFQQGLFVSAVSLGALLGSHLVLMHLVDRIGRRSEIRACAVLYLIGTLLNVISGTILSTSSETVGFSVLICGRLVYGIGVGFIMHGVSSISWF